MESRGRFVLDKYDFKSIEKEVLDLWKQTDVYKWDSNCPREENYVIDTPPPTVSGSLHIGHAFSYTQTDYMARFKRMSGKNVFYPIGFDDNGLPSERLVEKQLKVRASDYSREEFVKLCHDVVHDAEDGFRDLFVRLGISYDWDLEYTTISPHAWRMSQMSLLDLFEKGHLYRQPQPTLWDPVDRTAIAQAEVVDQEHQGTLYDIPFELADGSKIVIATTRPELLIACVAVMYNPEDPRAASLAGQKAFTALVGAEVPLIADEAVDMEKGTGLVMCCTFGDPTDIEWWRTHNLPLRNVVAKDGTLRNMESIGTPEWPVRDTATAKAAADALTGQHVRKARKLVLDMLRAEDLIAGETSVHQMIPSAERSKSPLEILVTEQWMIRLLDKKEQLIEQGRKITWHPAFMRQRYEDWVQNLKWDWCISRQRYFGVPVPFWYSKRPGEEGKILSAHKDDLPVNPLVDAPRGYRLDEVEPDVDVLDTWATSSVSPQISSYGINEEFVLDTDRHSRVFPADLRSQSHEIIRTWLFYTVAKSLMHADVLPFDQAAISGWCLAEGGGKMSKSAGNIIDPNKILDQSGSDVLRYWSASGRLGNDTAFSPDLLKIGKRLVTKLWNASRLSAGHLEAHTVRSATAAEAVAKGEITDTFDLWILSRARAAIEEVTQHFENYSYTSAIEAAERFFWSDYTNNYLELCKGRLYGDVSTGSGNTTGVLDTLYFVHEAVLKLFAPFLPYSVEYLYQAMYAGKQGQHVSVHARGSWPKAANFPSDTAAVKASETAVDILGAVRKYKSNMQLSMSVPIERIMVAPSAESAGTLELDGTLQDLAHTVQTTSIEPMTGLPAGAEAVEGPDGLVCIVVEMKPAAA